MATENILMDAVKAGGDRQELHERIRTHSMAAGKRVKEEGLENDLLDRIAADPAFNMTKEQLLSLMKPENFVGCAPAQTEEFLLSLIHISYCFETRSCEPYSLRRIRFLYSCCLSPF